MKSCRCNYPSPTTKEQCILPWSDEHEVHTDGHTSWRDPLLVFDQRIIHGLQTGDPRAIVELFETVGGTTVRSYTVSR